MFETGSLIGLSLTKLTRLTGQQDPRTCLYLPPQCWDWKFMLLKWCFNVSSVNKTRVLTFCTATIVLTALFPQSFMGISVKS